MNDVPDVEILDFVARIPQLLKPGAVHELKAAVGPAALDHVGRVLDYGSIPFLAFGQAGFKRFPELITHACFLL